MGLLLTLPGVIIAITFHEFAHAYAAYKLGDDTPKMQGRLNLNPLSHLDPTGFILLIFAHVGWGKPVQINPRNFDRKYSQGGRRGNCIGGRTTNEFYTCDSIYGDILCITKICNEFCNISSRNDYNYNNTIYNNSKCRIRSI